MDDDRPAHDLTDAASMLGTRFGRLGGGFGRVLAAWERIVGPDVARHAMPSSLRDGVLRVRCDDAAWTSEMLHLSADLLPALSTALGSYAPTSMQPYTGRVQSTRPPTAPTGPPLPQLSPGQIASIEATAASIDDPVLRAHVVRAMTACTARRLAADPLLGQP